MRRVLLPLLLLAPAPALAQQTDEQLWLAVTGSVKVDDGVKVSVESVARFGDRAGGIANAQIGGSATFTLAKGVDLLIGYRHVQDYDAAGARPDEERVRQQIMVTLGGGFSTQLRVEERFHASGGEMGLRARPQIRFTLPLGGGFAASVTHEDFWNVNTTAWGQQGGYERMRNSVGLSIPLSPQLKGEATYLNQYRFGRGGARDQMDHIATFSLTLTL